MRWYTLKFVDLSTPVTCHSYVVRLDSSVFVPYIHYMILGVVRLNSRTKSATESDIIEVIKNWLVRSKERSNKFQPKKKSQNTVCSVCETDATCETVSVSGKDSVCETSQP